MVLQPKIDAYGGPARASCLTDYLEVAALTGTRITLARLDDIADEMNWLRKSRQLILAPADEDEPDLWSDATRSTIEERAWTLNGSYPFELQANRLRVRPGFDTRASSYVALLGITVAHGWDLDSDIAPDAALESLAVEALGRLGLKAIGMGTNDRADMDFAANLDISARGIGLRPNPDPRPRRRFAKDEGVDTLAIVDLKDPSTRRCGEWVFIGQSTLEQSDGWEGKLDQPKPWRWADYLLEPIPPQPFLVLAHHVLEDHLRELMVTRTGIVFDRLRLTSHLALDTNIERHFNDLVHDVTVEG